MAGASTRRTSVAVVCVTILLFSTVAPNIAGAVVTSGGTTTAAAAGNAPGVDLPDTAIDASSDSTIEVAYNATGQGVAAGNLEVILVDSNGNFLGSNSSLTSVVGVANVTITAGALSSDDTVRADLVDSPNQLSLAFDTASFAVSGSGGGGGGGGGIPAAPYVNGTDRLLDPSVQTTLQLTYNATGQVASAGDIAVAVKNDSSGQIIGVNNSLSYTAGLANVTIPAGEGVSPFSATIFLNDTNTGSTLTIDVANYSAGSGGGGGGGGGSGSVNISGYVSDANGNGIANANVTAYGPTQIYTTTTNASGGYNLSGSAGFYGLEFNASGYGVASDFVELEDGQNATVNVTLEPPGYLAGTVEDEDGNPVSGVTVDAWGPSAVSTTTDAQGRYNLSVSAGSYFLEVRSSAHPSMAFRGISVTTGQTTTRNVTLQDPGYVTARVVNSSNVAVANAWVMLDSGDQMAFGTTNKTGHLNLSVVAGTYRLTAFGTQGGMGSHDSDIDVTTGNTTAVGTVTMVSPEVVSSSVRHVNGTTPDMSNISVNGFAMGGMMGVMLENGTSSGQNGQGMPQNLSTVGVDNTTVFEINFTVTDFDPNALLWGARDVTWNARQNQSNPSATDITVRTKAVHLAGIDGKVGGQRLPVGPMGMSGMSPDDFKWPTGAKDKADLGWTNTVYFLMYDLSNVPASVSQNLDNMTVVTNAQTFSRPQMVNDTLKVYVAGPHYTRTGDVHDGFYSAFIPNAQLDAWGVTDPATELAAKYQGSSKNFNVEVTNDGAWIHLDIHYSDGYAEIAPDTSGSSGSGGSGSTSSTTSDTTDDTDDTDSEDSTTNETDSNTTSVTVGQATTNADGTQTATAAVSNAKANSTVSLTFTASADDPAENESEDTTDAALEELNVSLADDADFNVNVSTAVDAPDEAAASGDPDGASVVSYVQIDHEGLSDDQISAASLTVRVKKSRFGDDFDPTNAVVYRLHDGEWTELETTLIGETATHYRFRADSPGLSVFAVGEKSPDLSASVSLDTTTATVGQDVAVDVTVTNDGTGQGTYSATLTVDGTTVTSRTVTVPAGEQVVVSLGWEFGAGGEYALAVNGDAVGTIDVTQVERVTSTTTTADPTTTTSMPTTTTATGASSDDGTTSAQTPGFGLVAALLALAGAALLARD